MKDRITYPSVRPLSAVNFIRPQLLKVAIAHTGGPWAPLEPHDQGVLLPVPGLVHVVGHPEHVRTLADGDVAKVLVEGRAMA